MLPCLRLNDVHAAHISRHVRQALRLVVQRQTLQLHSTIKYGQHSAAPGTLTIALTTSRSILYSHINTPFNGRTRILRNPSDQVGRPLRNSDDRDTRMPRDLVREDRRVHHAQRPDPMHTQLWVHDARLGIRAHPSGRRLQWAAVRAISDRNGKRIVIGDVLVLTGCVADCPYLRMNASISSSETCVCACVYEKVR